jgi:hypothetical protein
MSRRKVDLDAPVPAPRPGHKGVKDAMLDLVPPEWLWGLSQVYGMGAMKYAPRNWERGYEFSKAIGAHGRHMQLWIAGQDNDPESNLNHLLHASWMLAALYTFQVRGIGVDDRPHGANIDMMSAVLLNPQDIDTAHAEQKKNDTDETKEI